MQAGPVNGHQSQGAAQEPKKMPWELVGAMFGLAGLGVCVGIKKWRWKVGAPTLAASVGCFYLNSKKGVRAVSIDPAVGAEALANLQARVQNKEDEHVDVALDLPVLPRKCKKLDEEPLLRLLAVTDPAQWEYESIVAVLDVLKTLSQDSDKQRTYLEGITPQAGYALTKVRVEKHKAELKQIIDAMLWIRPAMAELLESGEESRSFSRDGQVYLRLKRNYEEVELPDDAPGDAQLASAIQPRYKEAGFEVYIPKATLDHANEKPTALRLGFFVRKMLKGRGWTCKWKVGRNSARLLLKAEGKHQEEMALLAGQQEEEHVLMPPAAGGSQALVLKSDVDKHRKPLMEALEKAVNLLPWDADYHKKIYDDLFKGRTFSASLQAKHTHLREEKHQLSLHMLFVLTRELEAKIGVLRERGVRGSSVLLCYRELGVVELGFDPGNGGMLSVTLAEGVEADETGIRVMDQSISNKKWARPWAAHYCLTQEMLATYMAEYLFTAPGQQRPDIVAQMVNGRPAMIVFLSGMPEELMVGPAQVPSVPLIQEAGGGPPHLQIRDVAHNQ